MTVYYHYSHLFNLAHKEKRPVSKTVPAFKAVIEWQELWEITKDQEGNIIETRPTHKHIPYGSKIPEGYTTASISAKPGTEVTINPY